MNYEFERVIELCKFLEKIKDENYFRGFSIKSQMKPSLGRVKNLFIFEQDIISEFACSQEVHNLHINTLQRLFELGQHYSLPTRLLDWTLDPFVALYFTLGKEEQSIISPKYIAFIDKKSIPLVDISNILDVKFRISEFNNYKCEEVNGLTLEEMSSLGFQRKHSEICDYIRMKPIWEKFINYIEMNPSYIFFSYHKDIKNLRMEAQKGVFTCCKFVHEEFSIEKLSTIEIRLSDQQMKKAKYELNDMGINNESLFPDNETYKKIEFHSKNIKERYCKCNNNENYS